MPIKNEQFRTIKKKITKNTSKSDHVTQEKTHPFLMIWEQIYCCFCSKYVPIESK